MLTAAIGLERSLLFTDADAAPSPQTARFTYAGSVTIGSRTNRADVTTFTGDGVLRIYLQVHDAAAGGASWDDPGSFAVGEPVAEYSIRLLDTLQRQAPGVGVLVGDGELAQETAAEFSLDGERYHFGAVGIAQRLRYVGSQLGGNASPGILAVGLTGSASVLGHEVIAINVGAPAATPAATATKDCPQLQPWLGQTLDALSQARLHGAKSGVEGELATLDADTVRDAAAEVAALGQAQRAIAAPEDAVAANRLVVTAFEHVRPRTGGGGQRGRRPGPRSLGPGSGRARRWQPGPSARGRVRHYPGQYLRTARVLMSESTYLATRPADRDFRPKIATEVLSTAKRQTCHAEERSISIQVATLASSKNSCLRMCDAHLLGLHHDKQVRDVLHRRHRRPFAARL